RIGTVRVKAPSGGTNLLSFISTRPWACGYPRSTTLGHRQAGMFLLVTFDLEQIQRYRAEAPHQYASIIGVIISSDLVVLFDLAQSNFGFM
ncbi:hypothetical protein, partial [Mycobacterium sp.]|uniref:hypothetical protein n=1 Tax=Mycobacterium sp. TaxID=1785 RepID=UPI003C738D32